MANPFYRLKWDMALFITGELAIPDENALEYERDTVMTTRAREQELGVPDLAKAARANLPVTAVGVLGNHDVLRLDLPGG